MANIYYGVTSPSLNLDVQMELSDADSQRIMTYLVAGSPYGTVTENVQSQVPNPALRSHKARLFTPLLGRYQIFDYRNTMCYTNLPLLAGHARNRKVK